MYYSLYQILAEFFYGVGVELTNFQDLTLTLLSTICVVFCVSIPFVVVWRAIKIFV